jgi:DtxR family Mn-dependent transcriptional regulator
MLRYLAERGIAPGDTLCVDDRQPFGGPLFVTIEKTQHVLGGTLAEAMRVRL